MLHESQVYGIMIPQVRVQRWARHSALLPSVTTIPLTTFPAVLLMPMTYSFHTGRPYLPHRFTRFAHLPTPSLWQPPACSLNLWLRFCFFVCFKPKLHLRLHLCLAPALPPRSLTGFPCSVLSE